MKRITINKNQKVILASTLSIIVVSLVLWLAYGVEIFTKFEVLVDVKDELFDTTYKEWRDKFIWGLDLSLVLSGAAALIGLVSVYLFRTKLKHN